ncbi:choice-of-anchor L domain-containing protein [Microbacterium tumbae]
MPRHARALAGAALTVALIGGSLAAALPAAAAPLVTTNLSAEELAETIIGTGIGTVSDVSFTGAPSAAGVFGGFDAALGITSGLILSSGSAAAIVGPNTLPNTSTEQGTPGDLTLWPDSHDAAILEFDFVPDSSLLTFTYVFGSEEYPEWVDFGVNDAFDLRVNETACAVVPGTSTPVSIDTINANANAQYYVSGDGSQVTEMDGYTTPLTCTATVTPDETNRLRLSIADIGDSIYDSWVLIQAQSVRVDAAPTAADLSASTENDLPVEITLQGSDEDDDPITYDIAAQPAHGSVSITGATAGYMPDPGFHGSDSFQYTASSNGLVSDPATVSIEVAQNLPPTAGDVVATTEVDIATPLELLGADPEDDEVTYDVDDPASGSLSGTAPDLVYTPDAGFTGIDAFAYRVDDGRFSTEGTVTVTVEPNEAPTADDQSVSVPFGGQGAILLSGHDPEDAALAFTVTTEPAHGTLTGTAPDLRYAPDAGFVGEDSFAFTVSDGRFTSEPASVRIDVPRPQLAVSPASGHRGDEFTVTGEGFPPSAEVVLELHSTPLPLGSVVTDDDGTFTTTLSVPASADIGAHRVVAILDDVEAASDDFAVVAAAVTAPEAPDETGELPYTGADAPWSLLLGAGLLIVLGAVLRRRRTRA